MHNYPFLFCLNCCTFYHIITLSRVGEVSSIMKSLENGNMLTGNYLIDIMVLYGLCGG